MKIQITTTREIADSDFDEYIETLKKSGCRIDGEKLKKDGVCEFSDDIGYTRATTTYRIVK